jgi:hypothetical protein
MRKSDSVLAAAVLAAACALPAAGAIRLTQGQEFLYTGTAEWRETPAGRPPAIHRGAVRVTVLVTQADPDHGYAAIVMRAVQPVMEKGQARLAGYGDLTAARWRADLSRDYAWPGHIPQDPLGNLIQVLDVPLGPSDYLKVAAQPGAGILNPAGRRWLADDHHPALLSAGFWVLYQVAGGTKVGDRTCVVIGKRLGRRVPAEFASQFPGGRNLRPPRREFAEGYFEELTGYGETLTIDPVTMEVLSQKLHARRRQVLGKERITLDLSAAITLRQIQQLAPAELASRVRQAEILGRVEQAATYTFQAATHTLSPKEPRVLEEAAQTLAAFRKEFPGSPYTAAIPPIEASLTQLRREAHEEARLQAIKGTRAPDFALKNLEGKEETFGTYRGKLVLLNFFASW